jgi:hypothetical protein
LSNPFEIAKLFMCTRFDVNDSDNEIEVDWPELASDSGDGSGDESDGDPKP